MGWRLARHLAAACAGTMLVLAAGSAGAAAPDAWKLDTGGFGPYRIGMRFAQAQAVAPGLEATPEGLRASPGCDYVGMPGHPGVALMFVNGVLRRADIGEPGERTSRGIGPGDTVASFDQAYPGATRTPNAYDDSEAYLTVGPERGRALRAETREGKISGIYAGGWKEVQYIEGCL
jgi:hypothetical protein